MCGSNFLPNWPKIRVSFSLLIIFRLIPFEWHGETVCVHCIFITCKYAQRIQFEMDTRLSFIYVYSIARFTTLRTNVPITMLMQ